MQKKIVLFLLLIFIQIPLVSDATLRLIEDKKKIKIDPPGMSRENKIRYKIFKQKCSQHHELTRPLQAIKTGVTPVTKSKFDKAGVKKYLIKMMRKPNSGVDRESAKSIQKLIYYLIDNKDQIPEIPK